jgi:hypothetical protein
MTHDPEWFKPHRPPSPPRQPQPGELLFEFYRERDHTRWRCELRQHPEPYASRRRSTFGHGAWTTAQREHGSCHKP